jgi:hypothetical protein
VNPIAKNRNQIVALAVYFLFWNLDDICLPVLAAPGFTAAQ